MEKNSDDPVVMALKAALESNDTLEVRRALGERLLALGDFEEALTAFEAGLRLSPGDGAVLAGAREAASEAGQSVKAEAYGIALKAVGESDFDSAPDEKVAVKTDDISPPCEGDRRPLTGEPLLRIVGDEERGDADRDNAITFLDVAGMEEVKAAINRAFLLPLRNPEIHRKFGKKVHGGLLLYGPPGCGKTYLARALAGEIGARFVNISLSDVLDMWYGETEKKIHEIFENARRRSPTLLFFDEADALGQKRSQLKGSAGRNSVNALLAEMDGFEDRNEGTFFLAATNHPWDVDAALRRPGRFDRLVFVPPPDRVARARLLELKLNDRPMSKDIAFDRLAAATRGFSGADMEALVERATEFTIEYNLEHNLEMPIDNSALDRALDEMQSSTRPWLELARNYALYANEGGIYDELYDYLKSQRLA